MILFEKTKKALAHLTKISPYNIMVMNDIIGLYFQNTLVCRFKSNNDIINVEFTETTQKDAKDAILDFLKQQNIPYTA